MVVISCSFALRKMAYQSGTQNSNDTHNSTAETEGLPHAVQVQLQVQGLEEVQDYFVDWCHNNPEHPRNWQMGRKLFDTSVMMFLEFFTYVS